MSPVLGDISSIEPGAHEKPGPYRLRQIEWNYDRIPEKDVAQPAPGQDCFDHDAFPSMLNDQSICQDVSSGGPAYSDAPVGVVASHVLFDGESLRCGKPS